MKPNRIRKRANRKGVDIVAATLLLSDNRAHGKFTSQDVAALARVPLGTASDYLREMRKIGLAAADRVGKQKIYCLTNRDFDPVAVTQRILDNKYVRYERDKQRVNGGEVMPKKETQEVKLEPEISNDDIHAMVDKFSKHYRAQALLTLALEDYRDDRLDDDDAARYMLRMCEVLTRAWRLGADNAI